MAQRAAVGITGENDKQIRIGIIGKRVARATCFFDIISPSSVRFDQPHVSPAGDTDESADSAASSAHTHDIINKTSCPALWISWNLRLGIDNFPNLFYISLR